MSILAVVSSVFLAFAFGAAFGHAINTDIRTKLTAVREELGLRNQQLAELRVRSASELARASETIAEYDEIFDDLDRHNARKAAVILPWRQSPKTGR